MIPIQTLHGAWRTERARRLSRYRRLPSLADAGLELGAMTVIAARTRDRWGAADLALKGNEARILALLAVAHWRPVSPSVIGYLRRAAKAMARGDAALAAIHIAHTGLPKIDEDERTAFRLFAAEKLLDAGVTPRELLEGLGLDPWPLDALKYNPDESRDDHGRWTDGGQIAANAGLQIASNEEEVVPLPEVHGRSKGTDPLDPKRIHVTVTGEEAQSIAATIKKIDQGDDTGLKPHPYRNDPDPDTGAVLPQSVAGYRAYDVSSPGGGRGARRIIVDIGTGEMYYTGDHYKSFIRIDIQRVRVP